MRKSQRLLDRPILELRDGTILMTNTISRHIVTIIASLATATGIATSGAVAGFLHHVASHGGVLYAHDFVLLAGLIPWLALTACGVGVDWIRRKVRG